MKKIKQTISVMLSIVLLMNISFGYTLTITKGSTVLSRTGILEGATVGFGSTEPVAWTITSGGVTPIRNNIFEGQFNMPAQDVEITLSGLPITECVQLGDYVEYDTSNLPDIQFLTTDPGSSGTLQTFKPSSYIGGWRVVDIDETTGVVSIASASPVDTLALRGDTSSSSKGIAGLQKVLNGYINSNFATAADTPYRTDSLLYQTLGFDSTACWTLEGANYVAYGIYGETWYDTGLYLTDGSRGAWYTYNDYDKRVERNSAYSAKFRPVIKLKSEFLVVKGDGTSSYPFVLETN